MSEINLAALVLEKLLFVCDGGEAQEIGQFDASTILLMLNDAVYREKVTQAHDQMFVWDKESDR